MALDASGNGLSDVAEEATYLGLKEQMDLLPDLTPARYMPPRLFKLETLEHKDVAAMGRKEPSYCAALLEQNQRRQIPE